MNPTKLSRSVLDQIKKEKITPRARWEFVVKTFLFFIGGLVFLTLGILATAIIWHFLHDLYLLEIFSVEKRAFFKVLFAGLPIIWILISGALVFLTSFFVHHTRKGYKIPMHIWVVFAILIQILGGYILEQSPVGERLERVMTYQLRFGGNIEDVRNKMWSNPEEGMIAGTILGKDGEVLTLKDLQGKEWKVDVSNAKYMKDRIQLQKEEKIRMLGKMKNDTEFKAIRILPWERKLGDRLRMREGRSPRMREELRERRLRLERRF